MTLKNCLYNLRNGRVRVSSLVVLRYPGFVFGELTKNVSDSKARASGAILVLNVLDHLPRQITRTVIRMVAVRENLVNRKKESPWFADRIEQIRNQTVLQGLGLPGSREAELTNL